MKLRKRLTKKEANYLGLVVKEDGNDGSNARYMLSEDQIDAITKKVKMVKRYLL